MMVVGILLCRLLPSCSAAESVTYLHQDVNGVKVYMAFVDLNDHSLLVTPAIGGETPDQRKTFRQFIKDDHPIVQITGGYFDLQDGIPIGDIVIGGRPCFNTLRMGTALALTPDNRAFMYDTVPQSIYDWNGYESVLQGGVRLVSHGMNVVDPLGQGFHDHYMMRKTTRVAVGILPNNGLVFLTSAGQLLLPDLADLMIRVGCQDAMALDGGGSTAFAYNGRCMMVTSRKLSNVLMVLRRYPVDDPQNDTSDLALWEQSWNRLLSMNDLTIWNPPVNAMSNWEDLLSSLQPPASPDTPMSLPDTEATRLRTTTGVRPV
jgi:hypothetical protein